MWPCGQNLIPLAFLSEKLWQPQFYKDLTRKKTIFLKDALRSSSIISNWHTLGMTLIFYTSVGKELKFKVGNLTLTFVEVTGEKLVGGLFASPSSE